MSSPSSASVPSSSSMAQTETESESATPSAGPSSKIVYKTGDLFTSPTNSILIHACNTQGSWGAGIALAFKQRFPAQFKAYAAHCKATPDDEFIGTCLVLRASDFEGGGSKKPQPKWDVACLFTSRAYGRRKDAPEEILKNTERAIRDLIRQNEAGKELHAWFARSRLSLVYRHS